MYELEAIKLGYSIDKEGVCRNPKGNVLKGSPHNKRGKIYLSFKIQIGTSRKNVYFHKLQAYMKFGDLLYNEGIVVRHLDDNSLNNSWNNIEIGTQSDNMMDKPAEARSELAGRISTKYSQEFKLEVVEYAKTHTAREISEHFNITVPSVKYIKRSMK